MALHRLTALTLGVPDVDGTRAFYRDFGLAEPAPGRFATADGGEQLRLVPAPRRCLVELGVGAADADDLARIARALGKLGIPATADGDGLRAVEPAAGLAVVVRVAPRIVQVPAPALPVNAPGRPDRAGGRSPALFRSQPPRPRKLAHVVLTSPDPAATTRFCVEGLGFKVSDRIGDDAAFMRCSTDHHNLLVQGAPVAFVHHTAWEMADVDEVVRAASAMLAQDPARQVWGLGRHHIGSNYFWYLRDPAGNFAEYTSDVDVILPAGAAPAIPLAERGHRVTVLERRPAQETEDTTSGELLVPATQEECCRLGLALEGDWVLDRITAVRNVYPDLSWTLHPFPDGASLLSIDRAGFTAALRRRIVASGARLVWNARVTGIGVGAETACVATADGGEHTARVVVDCGGRHAPSLTALRLKVEEPEFRQIAVAVFFESFRDAPVHTWDRHLHGDRGVLWSGSRITPGRWRWILEADLADKQEARMTPIEFYEATVRRYDPWGWARIASAPRIGAPWAMAPLAYRVKATASARLVLAGDATGYLSPITGQGIEFAMRMGRLAADAVHDALLRDDCSAAAFASYVEGRRVEVEQAVEAVRAQLRLMRDRNALLRCAADDAFRAARMGPVYAVAADRGSLASDAAGSRPVPGARR